MSFETTSIILAWGAIVILGLAMSGLLRQVHALSAANSMTSFPVGPTVGSKAPSFEGLSAWGPVTTILLFADEGCSNCASVMKAFDEQRVDAAGLRVVTVLPSGRNGHIPATMEVIENRPNAFALYRVSSTPFAVAVDSDGLVVAAEPVGSSDKLKDFLAQQRERSLL